MLAVRGKPGTTVSVLNVVSLDNRLEFCSVESTKAICSSHYSLVDECSVAILASHGMISIILGVPYCLLVSVVQYWYSICNLKLHQVFAVSADERLFLITQNGKCCAGHVLLPPKAPPQTH